MRGLVFREHEGAYLVGVIFGLLSSGEYEGYPASDTFGAVGAIDLPFIRRWYVGFEEGVKSVKPDANVLLAWGNGFNDPATSKELALAQNDQGAQYIFAFAAAGNFGIFEAAAERGFFTSGVDTDQRSVDPAHIVESVVKRTDVGVYESVTRPRAGHVRRAASGTTVWPRTASGPAFLILDEPDPPVTLPQEVQDAVRDGGRADRLGRDRRDRLPGPAGTGGEPGRGGQPGRLSRRRPRRASPAASPAA